MKENYFVIRNSDGETTVEQLTKEQLLKAVEENEYSEGIFDNLPSDTDTNYWGGNALIIKGSVVTPVAKQIITKFDIE